MSIKIQIVSDLHIEFWQNKQKFNFIKPSAPYLALLGDTCCLGSDDDFTLFKRFMEEIKPLFKMIIIVAGNHEYYFSGNRPTMDNTMDACNEKLKRYCRLKENSHVHFLNNSSITLSQGKNKYIIAGSVLWSFIPPDRRKDIQDMMNDYRNIYVTDKSDSKTAPKIRNVTSDEITKLHIANVRYIKSQVTRAKKQDAKLIVLTHHKPYKSKNYDSNKFMCAYESDLTSIMDSSVLKIWCYGHTHVKDNSRVKNVALISNPKGYPYQNTKFNNDFSISF